jgi:hypothetical protein
LKSRHKNRRGYHEHDEEHDSDHEPSHDFLLLLFPHAYPAPPMLSPNKNIVSGSLACFKGDMREGSGFI